MKAQVLDHPDSVENNPLHLREVERPTPAPGEVLVRVRACGVCHTDLHVVEGELPNPKLPIIPGHEIVGIVEARGDGATRFQIGDRVGIPWLHWSDQTCIYCQHGQENLCDAAQFTGYTANGGYAEYVTAHEQYAVSIPDQFSDINAAPLLCAGVVGYRSLRLSDLQPGERLGLYGFGASAHLCIQVARFWGCEVYAFTRSPEHQRHARELGAAWAGSSGDEPPRKLDRAIIFAPAGAIVPQALGHLRKGGTLAINAIHMSDIPSMHYRTLWDERTVRSIANATRQDAEEFMPLAAQIPIRSETQAFDLDDANHVLQQVKKSAITGAAVLRV
jgi:propanol-preferring alcohol dehydrogenase